MSVNLMYLKDFDGSELNPDFVNKCITKYEENVGSECANYGSLEECSELIQSIIACLNHLNKPFSSTESIWDNDIIVDLIEEMADVCIVICSRMNKYHIHPTTIDSNIKLMKYGQDWCDHLSTEDLGHSCIFFLSRLSQCISKCLRWDMKPMPECEDDENFKSLISSICNTIIRLDSLKDRYNINGNHVKQMIVYKLSERDEKVDAGVYTGKMSKEEFYRQKKEKLGY